MAPARVEAALHGLKEVADGNTEREVMAARGLIPVDLYRKLGAQ